MEWTKEQKSAIDMRDCNLLVAAGAGSGKTAVLVERIISKIINDNIDIDKLLVVTFTNASASEMRERIAERLYKELEKNNSLQRQITLLSKANISTLHSFCLKVIRDNFFLTDLDPNFRVADQVESDLLKNEVLDELMEEKYDCLDSEFKDLIDTYTSNRDDTGIKNITLSIYDFIQSTSNPQEWLKEKCEMFKLEGMDDFAKTLWGKYMLNDAIDVINDEIEILKQYEKELTDYNNYLLTIQDDILLLRALKEKNDTWDDFYNQIKTLEFSKLKPCKELDEELKNEVKEARDKMKKIVKEYLKDNVFVACSNDIFEDMKMLYKNMISISNFVLDFENKYNVKKHERNIVDFNDIEHIALKLLIDNESVRNNYKNKFEEILIDEYQDTSMIQEAIINTISSNKTFMVGDIKQSIYRFRHARPELFLEKYKSFNDDSEYGKKVLLFKNFRSNKNIIEATNYVFKQIMSEEIGEIDYSEDEYLQFGADYYPTDDEPTELHLIEKNNDGVDELDDDIEDKPQLEARVVANRILELVGNYDVYDKKSKIVRKCEYRDIVVLMRSTKNYSDIFLEELSKRNIPVYADNQIGYFDNSEVEIVLSLLKIIDNPKQDIPLIAVLRSQIGNFNVDELTAIRLVDRSCDFYSAMQKFSSSDAEVEEVLDLSLKVKEFLKKLNDWREKANYYSLFDLLWLLYEETGYYYYISLLPDGSRRRANLDILLEHVKKFESTSFKGVFNFLNYVDNIRDSSGDLESGKIIGENENVVRIMSIHKSKGLEFPIVFISGTSKKFNNRDFQEKIILHQDMGFGPDVIKYSKRITYSSIPKLAIILKSKVEMLSEEMRILYVAMTRARQKLIITSMCGNIEKYMQKMEPAVTHYSISKGISPIDWIAQCVIGKENDWIIKEWHYEDVLRLSDVSEKNYLKLIDNLGRFTSSDNYKMVDEELSWKYKYEEATKLPAKISISEIKRMQVEDDELKTDISLIAKPKFMEDIVVTGTDYGTRVHFILQNLNYNEPNIDLYTSNLDDKTKKLIVKQISDYTKSNLFERIKKSSKVFRETSFNLNINANEIYDLKDCDLDEKIMLQGIIDLYFIEDDEIVLVDFKTDNVSNENDLIKKYAIQLEYYKRALEEITNMKVKETLIYSLKLNKEVRL